MNADEMFCGSSCRALRLIRLSCCLRSSHWRSSPRPVSPLTTDEAVKHDWNSFVSKYFPSLTLFKNETFFFYQMENNITTQIDFFYHLIVIYIYLSFFSLFILKLKSKFIKDNIYYLVDYLLKWLDIFVFHIVFFVFLITFYKFV